MHRQTQSSCADVCVLLVALSGELLRCVCVLCQAPRYRERAMGAALLLLPASRRQDLLQVVRAEVDKESTPVALGHPNVLVEVDEL